VLVPFGAKLFLFRKYKQEGASRVPQTVGIWCLNARNLTKAKHDDLPGLSAILNTLLLLII